MTKIPLFNHLKGDQWVKPFFSQYRFILGLALFLGFLTFFAGGALMFNSGFLISKSASEPENILLVYVPIVLTRAFGIGRPVFRYLERLASHNWVLRMTSKLRLKLYQSLEGNAIFLKRDYRLGDVMGLLAEDINHLQNLYLRTIFPTIIAWILYFFIVVALGFVSLPFAIFVLLYFALILLALPLWSVLANGTRQSQEKTIKNALYTDLTDNVLGIADWIFSQRSQEYVSLHEAHEDKLQEVQAGLRHFNNRRNFIFEMVYGGLALVTLVWASNQFVGSHGGAANWIGAFVLAIFPVVDAFAGLSAAAQETNVYADSLVRLNDLPQVEDDSFDLDTLTVDKTPQVPYDLVIRDLSFVYPGTDRLILQKFNLTIPQGQKIALLGRSGSGKSTLAALMRGDLTASQGSIDLGGVPVAALGDHMAAYMGVIHQEPYLFNTTILDNVRLANPQASEDQVWQVLDQVGLNPMVESLPHGLDTMVDEAGLRFSGGERHRLALARILLADTPIVLLDEPTVGLDPITEKALIDTFMVALEGKTLIWITHHLKGIESVDRVLFIEDGVLEMEGSPADLAQSNARYQQLKAIDDGLV
ncbi:thiol reductant ABC exporter subunit CydC [Eremococcus coleocola]|uniref:Thiol reductant ABC exporter, CydC subunit n=1 Tax=Eremococcus coleocola ACS-139-V-Col8 TaxID=908337 RepID=E4KMM2_9LACT|nr:thiol reductant ABC exporter subunit CydC [Eremococcus coleocola]EFR31809.1 thiol reductant ABC exporter, CydC subunit [Eremococcus coleocola ACS-139-V-Col8]